MNTRLFYTFEEFNAWRYDQFPESPAMRNQVLLGVNGGVRYPAVLVFQWLVKSTEHGEPVYEFLHKWVTLADFNDSGEFRKVTIERKGGGKPEVVMLPPNPRAASKREPEKISVIRALKLE